MGTIVHAVVRQTTDDFDIFHVWTDREAADRQVAQLNEEAQRLREVVHAVKQTYKLTARSQPLDHGDYKTPWDQHLDHNMKLAAAYQVVHDKWLAEDYRPALELTLRLNGLSDRLDWAMGPELHLFDTTTHFYIRATDLD